MKSSFNKIGVSQTSRASLWVLFVTLMTLVTSLNYNKMEHRYTLEPWKGRNSRYTCPSCGATNKFSRYIDIETGLQLHRTVGMCERKDNCGYHYPPRDYFRDNNITVKPVISVKKNKKQVQPETKPISTIPIKTLAESLKAYKRNNFASFLYQRFGREMGDQLIVRYHIGTSRRWDGATVFWQVDKDERIRTGKVMLYDSATGKRVKKPYSHITWVHSILGKDDFNLQQCFFGEHLLVDQSKPVAIVESEKSAVIASAFFPEFIWLAAGSLSNLSPKRCKVLKGRDVVLFPDLNAFDKWNKIAGQLSMTSTCMISELLENKADEAARKAGLDLADYLLKFNLQDFLEPEIPIIHQQQEANDCKVPELEFGFGDATVGGALDYYKNLGYEELPDNVEINAVNFKGRPLKDKITTNQIKPKNDENN